jgi:NAD(P)-dependent dehydrogenase (short-subunit alcohol dehydrogenase family)
MDRVPFTEHVPGAQRVAPGPVETGMLNRLTGTPERKAGLVAGIPMQRVGVPEEIAQTILFLAPTEAPFLAGQIASVDGGKSAS